MKKVGILGAFSRNNYGDVLMPIVVSKSLSNRSKNISFNYYSYKKSDLSEIGGVPSLSLSDLYRDYNNLSWVIVAGGQVFGQEHRRMYPLEFDMNHPFMAHAAQILFKVAGKISSSVVNNFCRKRIHVNSSFPWVVENPFDPKNVIYNTVGGNFESLPKRKEYHSAIQVLSESPVLSIRSHSDYDIWNSVLSNASLIPDSVGIISDLYDTDDLIKKSKKTDFILSNEDYFVFQISRENGEGKESDIASALQEACRDTGLRCLLVPMGYAAGHEDQIVLRHIDRLTDSNISILDEANIFEITLALSCAKAYIGSSLHGAIVSCSYNVPHSTIIVPNKKTEEYIRGWNTSVIPSTRIAEIPSTVTDLIKTNSVAHVQERNQFLKKLISSNFDYMTSLIIS